MSLLLNDIENANIEKLNVIIMNSKNGYLLNNNELTSLVFNFYNVQLRIPWVNAARPPTIYCDS